MEPLAATSSTSRSSTKGRNTKGRNTAASVSVPEHAAPQHQQCVPKPARTTEGNVDDPVRLSSCLTGGAGEKSLIRISLLLNPPAAAQAQDNTIVMSASAGSSTPRTAPPKSLGPGSGSGSGRGLAQESPQRGRRFQCQHCGKRYMTAAHLARHVAVHLGTKPYVCPFPECGLRFLRSDNCMQHYKTHNNPKGKTTKRMNRLKSGT